MATIKDILSNSRFADTPADFKIYATPLPEFTLKHGDGPTFQLGQSRTVAEFSVPLTKTLQIKGTFTRHEDTGRFDLKNTRSIPKGFNLK